MERSEIFIVFFKLVILFQVKHFICDFLLQTKYFRKKSSKDFEFLIPLTLHCFFHFMGTLLILLSFNAHTWIWAFFDFFVHFITDRIKSSPRYLGRFQNMQKQSFWCCFGLDQMVHHLTHYFIIWQIISSL